ncbi:hypothetical protein [Rhodoplanes sp. SY1]|uniref:hypothetical protein n=1 Tax=Rhodoplanes sp. SY1 TaxID=3166646 RepID=UPI0038B675D9
MRFSFPDFTRPKKSSKIIARKLGLPLSSVRAAVARICGYDDWHDFERNHAGETPFVLDQNLNQASYIARNTSLVLKLAATAGVTDGDAQYALAGSHLTGSRPVSLADQIDLRLNCWKQTVLPPAAKRSRGAVGVVKSAGWNGEVVILRSFGKPTSIVTHKNIGGVADFEFISPRDPPPLFLPMRLYLPYGHWIEVDGAKVLFARDYKPMWRIRQGYPPERLDPSLWIRFREQVHYWDDGATPWRVPGVRRQMEELLANLGVNCLPVWADVLPLAVHDDKIHGFAEALEPLQAARGHSRSDAA